MPASLEVIIRYGGSKYEKLASGTLSDKAAIQLLLKDLRGLRVNQPGQDNIKHVKGKFYLTWKSAGGHQDGFSLYNSWVKFAETKEKITALSIESITVNKIRVRTRTRHRSATPVSSSQDNAILQDNFDRDREFFLARTDHDDAQYGNAKYPNKQATTGHKQGPSVNIPQISENMEGPNQSLEMKSLDSLQALIDSFKTGTVVNTLHQQPAVQHYIAIGPDVASLSTPPGLAKQHPLPHRPVIIEAPLMKPQPAPNIDAKARLMRNLWDTRKEIAVLQERETDIIVALHTYHVDDPRQVVEAEPARHGTTDFEDRLVQVENELQRERYERLRAERRLNEIEKECKAPFVVPALLQAFLNLSEIDV